MKKPEIRFQGSSDEWEPCTLKDVCISFEYGLNAAAKKFDGKNKYIRISDIDDDTRLFLSYDLTSPDCDLRLAENYQLHDGDIVFARTGASVGKTFLYKASEGIVYYAGFLIRAKLKKAYYPDFVFYNTLTNRYGQFIRVTSQRSGQPGVNAQEYATFKFYNPLYCEQEKLGQYFRHLDNIIIQRQDKLKKIQTLRASMLEKMFPKDGADVPEVRFKGFTGAWKKYSFKNITYPSGTKNKDNILYESYSITNESGFVPQNEKFENGGTMKNADKRMYIIVEPHSFAYNPARINIGSIGYQYLDYNVIVSSLYEVFKTTDECNDQFLWYWFKTKAFDKMIEQLQEGGVRLYFYYDKLCMCSLKMPDVEEQSKIAEYFKNLDDLISACSKEIDKLQSIKKALLEKMFV